MMSMSPETLLAFTLAMFLLALSPGPGFLMVVARALSGGFAAGLAAIAGLALGVKSWRRLSFHLRQAAPTVRIPHHRSAALGFFVTLANPKAILFYGALLPTFVDVTALTASDVVVLSAVVILVLFLVLSVSAFLAARAGRLLKSERALVWLNRVTGGMLVGAGIAVATR